MSDFARTPDPPYYAVIFTSLRTEGDNGYGEMAARMEELVASQPGYLGMESARDGLGIIVSYWDSIESMKAWKQKVEHMAAQSKGRQTWYQSYRVRICKVEHDYGFERES
ncbi:MAG: antibiotic biosynthesis monooxygenase [Acidobacteriota bacterium]